MDSNNQNYQLIDWTKYVVALLKYWKQIGVITAVFAVIGVLVALNQEREYSVTVTLAPEASGGSSGSGSLGGIASMLGVSMGGSSGGSDALNVSIFPEIASSTPFLTSLFGVELNKMPQMPKNPIEARKIMNGPLPSVKLFDYLSGRDSDNSDKGFFASFFGSEAKDEEDSEYLIVEKNWLTREQFVVLGNLKKKISVEVDNKSGMTTVTVGMKDPLMCAQLADTVCQRLRDFIFAYRTEKERQNFEYYEAMCDSTYKTMVESQAAYASSIDNNQNVILQKVSMRSQRLEQEASVASQVYQQMVQQRELSRAHLQEVKPVFAVVEPATLPLIPVNSRTKTCINITLFGFILSCVWFLFGKDYTHNIYEELKEKMLQIGKK